MSAAVISLLSSMRVIWLLQAGEASASSWCCFCLPAAFCLHSSTLFFAPRKFSQPARDITFIQELLTISTLETCYLNFIASQL